MGGEINSFVPCISSTSTSGYKGGHKSSPDLSAAQTVNIKVESKVEELQVVGNGSESLEAKMFVK